MAADFWFFLSLFILTLMRPLLLTCWKHAKAVPRVRVVCYNQLDMCKTGVKISICSAINRRLMLIWCQHIRLLRDLLFVAIESVLRLFFFYKWGKLLKASKMKKENHKRRWFCLFVQKMCRIIFKLIHIGKNTGVGNFIADLM